MVGVLAAGLAVAAHATDPAPGTLPEEDVPVRVTADRIEYAGETHLLTAQGEVEVTRGGEVLRADFVQVNTETGEALARGNVELRRADGTVWRGVELAYNFRTGEGDLGAFRLHVAPFLLIAEDSEVVGRDRIELRGVLLTPCPEPAAREFRVTARRAVLKDERYVWVYHAVPWVGPVPVFYVPVWRRDLKRDGRWVFIPGYSSRLGAFLLSSYNAPLNERETVKSSTFVNTYTRRGFGFGQDLFWDAPDLDASGEFRAFYIRDARLYRSASERERREPTLDDPHRYRLRLAHRQAFSPRDRLFLDATFLSDPFVQEDFFREEYRAARQPDNRLTLTHRARTFTASLHLNARLNDFYGNVNRLPEARLSVPGLRLGDTGLVYEGDHSAAALERVFPAESEEAAYDSVRVDSLHRLRYPGRYFGFLSLEPRAGFRATYYSRTRGRPRTVGAEPDAGDTEDGLDDEALETETVPGEDRTGFRRVYELGLAASFRAFKVLHDRPLAWGGDGLRHAVEPYADVQWRPIPNLPPERLYAFDEIERIDGEHRLRFGVRNKLQTRRRRRVHDLLDADLNTFARLGDRAGEPVFGRIAADVRLRPLDRFRLDFDTALDPSSLAFERFNARSHWVAHDGSAVGLEYRSREGRPSTLSASWSYRPRHRWSLAGALRYGLDEGRIEEHSYAFQRRHDCIGWGIGFRHDPALEPGERDAYRVWVQFWLLSVPGAGLKLGG